MKIDISQPLETWLKFIAAAEQTTPGDLLRALAHEKVATAAAKEPVLSKYLQEHGWRPQPQESGQ